MISTLSLIEMTFQHRVKQIEEHLQKTRIAWSASVQRDFSSKYLIRLIKIGWLA